MSTFRGEFLTLDRITLPQRGTVAGNTNPIQHEGLVYNDVAQKTIKEYLNGQSLSRIGMVSVNSTPVAITNKTSAFNLMAAYTFPAGALNVAGKSFRLRAAGTYNLGATSTNVFKVNLGAITLATLTSGSNANTGVELPWEIDLVASTTSTGATGTVEAYGKLLIDIGATAAIAMTVYGASGVSSAIDLTATAALQVQANLGSGNASSTQTQRLQLVEFIN